MIEIKRDDYSCDEEFIAKVYCLKSDNNMTNKECNTYINSMLGSNYGESTTRGIAKYINLGQEIQSERNLSELKGENKEITTLKHEYNNYEQVKSYKEVVEINKDGSYSSDRLIGIENEDNLKDENFLLGVHNYDAKAWQIVSARNSIWNTQVKGGTITKLYASKINVKPRVNSVSTEEIKEWFKEFDRENKTVKNINYKHKEGKLLFEFPMVDLHYGKKGYVFEVGKESSSEQTEQNFLKVICDFKNRLKDKPISKIVFPIGNDLFNSDSTDGSTTRGTKQDNDMRWKQLFKSGLKMITQGIDVLSEIAPIDLIYVEGNHDTMSAYHLFVALDAYYRKDDVVNVIDSALTRQYYKWGKCLIGYSHGNCEGKRISGLMQKEQPKLWGETLYREWHLAHLHHEIAKEDNGLVIRHLPSITGTDAWHYNSGYVGALQKCQAFIWDKESGLMDILMSYV